MTYGEDSLRHKEWDKATGLFIGTTEYYKNVTTKTGWYIEDLTVTVKAVATNIWSPQILGLDQTMFYNSVTAGIVAVAILILAVAVVIRKKRRSKR